jgi:hypothetical protein
MHKDYAPKGILTLTKQTLAASGKDAAAILTVNEKLLGAGFINTTHRTFKLPVGPWS